MIVKIGTFSLYVRFSYLQDSMPVHRGVEWHFVMYRNLKISDGSQVGQANIPRYRRLHLHGAQALGTARLF